MAYGKTKVLTIRTPEGIEFSLQVAGPMSRFLSWLIDACCISAALGIASGLFQVIGKLSEQVGVALYILAAFVASVGYFILFEQLWRGQTLGKRLLRLRVIDKQGFRLRTSQIVVRNLLRAVDSLPAFYLVGGIASLFSLHGQRLGDIAANTIVARTPEIFVPDLEKISPDKYNSLQSYPHLAARLRSEVSPEEAFLAFRTLLRRDQLDPVARVALFGELATHFKSLVKFPQEALEGLTDERFLRDAVEIIFRRSDSRIVTR